VTETSPRINRLMEQMLGDKPGVVDDFWRAVSVCGTPLIEAIDDESALVTFLWRGEASHTATGWGINVQLNRIPGTDLWHGSQRLPTDLCTLYYLRHSDDYIPTSSDGTGNSHVDVLNPHQFRFPPDRTDPSDRPYWASVLELPEAPAETWSLSRPGVPRGSVLHTTLRTAALGGRRHVTVYRPAARHEPLALLVVFDGHLSRTALNIPTTLDNLIAAGRIPPTLAVFVHAPSGARRFRELRPSNALRHFVTHELMPWACQRFPLTHDPNRRVIAGSSLGGLAAAYIAMIAPHLFGNVIAQSGAFWWPASPSQQSQWLIRAYADRDALPIRFYLDVGDHETDSPRDDELDQLTVNRRLREVLVDRGYQVTYTEYVGAHDYINWRRTFGDGLLATLGDQPSLGAV
jgi:enterochelin esterase-like enzyme